MIFMFDNYKAIKRFKVDAAKVKFSEVASNSETTGGKKKNVRPVVRIAVCTAVAAAVVITGTITIPKLSQSSKVSDSFNIVACAADLPTANFDSTNDTRATLENSIQLSPVIDSFKVTGSNIKGVTYKCNTSAPSFPHIITNLGKLMAEFKPYCTITIPASDFRSSDLKNEFKKILASGTLDEYKNKYFGGKDIDESTYAYNFVYDNDSVVVVVYKISDLNSKGAECFCANYYTVKGDKQDTVDIVLQDSNQKNTIKSVDVTATFNDGTTETKTFNVAYNSIGLPYLKLN
jgi:hypothetical protein